MGKLFNLMVRMTFGLAILDTQCGFKAFAGTAAEALFSRQQLAGFGFDVEILILAEQLCLNVIEIPFSWINALNSKVHIVLDSLKMSYDFFRLKQRTNSTKRQCS